MLEQSLTTPASSLSASSHVIGSKDRTIVWLGDGERSSAHSCSALMAHLMTLVSHRYPGIIQVGTNRDFYHSAYSSILTNFNTKLQISIRDYQSPTPIRHGGFGPGARDSLTKIRLESGAQGGLKLS